MTGPQHYIQAQSLLSQARRAGYEDLGLIAAAQVHATLAQTAATVDLAHDTSPHEITTTLNADAWTPVLGGDSED